MLGVIAELGAADGRFPGRYYMFRDRVVVSNGTAFLAVDVNATKKKPTGPFAFTKEMAETLDMASEIHAPIFQPQLAHELVADKPFPDVMDGWAHGEPALCYAHNPRRNQPVHWRRWVVDRYYLSMALTAMSDFGVVQVRCSKELGDVTPIVLDVAIASIAIMPMLANAADENSPRIEL